MLSRNFWGYISLCKSQFAFSKPPLHWRIKPILLKQNCEPEMIGNGIWSWVSEHFIVKFSESLSTALGAGVPIFSWQCSESPHGMHKSWNINNSKTSLSKHFPFLLFGMLMSFLKFFLFDSRTQFCLFHCRRQTGRTQWMPYILQRLEFPN